MLLIGFGSKARQGKDTAAEAIKDHFDRLNQLNYRHLYKLSAKPVNVGIFKFATALYREANEFIECGVWENRSIYTGGETYDLPDWVQPDDNPQFSKLAPFGKHPKLLQWVGTELRRENFGENYWVDKLFSSIPANTDIALISDTRFLNEADGIKQRGGYTVNVTRLNEDGTQYYSTDRPSDHPSETELDNYNWDFKLVNSANHGALLAEQAITLAEYLRGLGQ